MEKLATTIRNKTKVEMTMITMTTSPKTIIMRKMRQLPVLFISQLITTPSPSKYESVVN